MAEAKRRLAAILSADAVGYSRLMGDDERATMATLDAARAVFRDQINDSGRVVDTAGDSVLAVFDSVVEAVDCAVAVQTGLAKLNAAQPDGRRMDFRIGVNLGDVFEKDDGTIYGDGVNVAARIESLAEPGGVCIAEAVHFQVKSKSDLGFEDVGIHAVKNISEPLRVFKVQLGTRATAPVSTDVQQEIRFCMAEDGTQLAYATAGDGPPLVRTGNWMTHLEYDWESPIWGHLMRELASHNRLIRYDARGNGLSDWEIDEISQETFISDLETVVDAIGIDRFAMFGVSQGCAIASAYAARHPDRVSHLVLYGGFAVGARRRGDPEALAQREALMTLIKSNWGGDNPAFRQFFTSLFVPEGTPEQAQWFNELERISISAENASRFYWAVGDFDVREDLANVKAPTLVLHCRDDAMVPMDQGRKMAAMIPGARFVALEGRNHLILEAEPAWQRFVSEVQAFLATES